MGKRFGPQNVPLLVRSRGLGMETEPAAEGAGAWVGGDAQKSLLPSPSLAGDERLGSGLENQLHLTGGQLRGHAHGSLHP